MLISGAQRPISMLSMFIDEDKNDDTITTNPFTAPLTKPSSHGPHIAGNPFSAPLVSSHKATKPVLRGDPFSNPLVPSKKGKFHKMKRPSPGTVMEHSLGPLKINLSKKPSKAPPRPPKAKTPWWASSQSSSDDWDIGPHHGAGDSSGSLRSQEWVPVEGDIGPRHGATGPPQPKTPAPLHPTPPSNKWNIGPRHGTGEEPGSLHAQKWVPAEGNIGSRHGEKKSVPKLQDVRWRPIQSNVGPRAAGESRVWDVQDEYA